jgi:hypothetical protein
MCSSFFKPSLPLLKRLPQSFVDVLRRESWGICTGWEKQCSLQTSSLGDEAARDQFLFWNELKRTVDAEQIRILKGLQQECRMTLMPLGLSGEEEEQVFQAETGVPSDAALYLFERLCASPGRQVCTVSMIKTPLREFRTRPHRGKALEMEIYLESIADPVSLPELFDALGEERNSVQACSVFLETLLNHPRIHLAVRQGEVRVVPPPPAPEVAIACCVRSSPVPVSVGELRQKLQGEDAAVLSMLEETDLPRSTRGSTGFRSGPRQERPERGKGSSPMDYVSIPLRKALFVRRDLGVVPFGPDRLGAVAHFPSVLTPALRQEICDRLAREVHEATVWISSPRHRQLLHVLPVDLRQAVREDPYLLEAVLMLDEHKRFQPDQRKGRLRFSRWSSDQVRSRSLPPFQDKEELRENSAASEMRDAPPNPYRDGTAAREIYEFLSRKPATYEEAEAWLSSAGFKAGRIRSAFYVVTSPVEDGRREDPRGHLSAKGHLYFAHRHPDGRISLHGRHPVLPPKKRSRPLRSEERGPGYGLK